MKKVLGIVAGVAMAFAVTSAQAVPVTFDLSISDGIPDGLYTPPAQNGISFVATGYDDYDPTSSIGSNVTFTSQRPITQSGGGLGVNGTGGDINSNVDGRGPTNEAIEFVFGSDVKLVSALFTSWDSSDEVDFILDGVLTANEVDLSSGSTFLWTPSTMYIGTNFGFGADGSTDDYKIRKITVEAVDKDVPEPEALAMLGFGLLGMAAVARRRRQTA